MERKVQKKASYLSHRQFQEESAIVASLKACGNKQDLCRGCAIHAQILRRGLLGRNLHIGSALVNMYAKCNVLGKAQELFDELSLRDVVSWNGLIAGYMQQGHGGEALRCYEKMQHEGLLPTSATFKCVIKACGSVGAIKRGEEIHVEIEKRKLLVNDVSLSTALLDMYAKCGALAKAQEVFDELTTRDIICWNALISGYSQHGHGKTALSCLERMQRDGISPDVVTFACALKACGCAEAVEKGKEIHSEISRQRLLGNDTLLANALLDMYCKCGALAEAQQLFNELHVRDLVTWTTLIAGYAHFGYPEQALDCFEKMQSKGFFPDATTFFCGVKACGSIRAIVRGQEIHSQIVRKGLLKHNIMLGNALVEMYAKCGVLAKAEEVFYELPAHDEASWIALIAGYAEHGYGEEALFCAEEMQREGFWPDANTYVCILKACSTIGAVEKGEEVHRKILKQGLLEIDIVLGTALIDMYTRCGALAKAQQVFDELPSRDTVCWTVLIMGYSHFGKYDSVLDLFTKMLKERIRPDVGTFTAVLNACSHSGRVDEGQKYYTTMINSYGIAPTLEHRTCMVDLFGRLGYFHEALTFIKKTSSSYYPVVWTALLGACQKWGNIELGKLAFENVVRLDGNAMAAYTLMKNIYAAAGMFEEVKKVDAMRVRNETCKQPGCSWWVDDGGNVHAFHIKDNLHPQSEKIHEKLNSIAEVMSQDDQCLHLLSVIRGTFNDAAKDDQCAHSEVLAIACALINTHVCVPICVATNVGTCVMCHSVSSSISKIEKCEIHVRDANCFHIFEDGKCSCGECW